MVKQILKLIGVNIENDKTIDIEIGKMVKINNRFTYRSQYRDKMDSKSQYREHKESNYIK